MNNRKLAGLLSFLFILNVVLVAAQDDSRKEGTHFLSKQREYSNGNFILLPDFTFTESIRQSVITHGTTYLVEFLYTMPSLPSKYSDPQSLKSVLLDIESLEGIEYWSGGRGRMHPYITRSHRVASSGNRSPLPPQEWPPGAAAVDFTQLQKDTSFGTNWYQVRVEEKSGALMMTTLNLTELKAFTRKTSDAGGVLFHMAVQPGTDSTIIYCAVALKKFPDIGWSASGVAGSFNHRVSALQAWFADRIYGG